MTSRKIPLADEMPAGRRLARACRVIFLLATVCSTLAEAQTKVVLLGSGTPIPDPTRSGPAVAVVANGQAYLFDAGAGVVRRAQEAAAKFGMDALEAPNLTRLFFTHLHSDHTLGYPDVILTPWVMGRSKPLEVYGPEGIASMTEHIKLAFAEDIAIRKEGVGRMSASGSDVNVHEFAEPGQIYSDGKITVRAIAVPHGSWRLAFEYAIEAEGRRIVISGDTSPTEAIANACSGCDVLFHEVYSAERFAQLPPEIKHTSRYLTPPRKSWLRSHPKPDRSSSSCTISFTSALRTESTWRKRFGRIIPERSRTAAI